MKPFRFQQFEIQQNSKVFRVGTDAVLLGALVEVVGAQNVLEVGTGSGIISLMIAQRNSKAQILALDIDENAVELSSQNFNQSNFREQLKVLHQDYKNFESENTFDLIVSNPPYFESNASEKDKLARQTVALNFSQLIEKSAELLNDSGALAVVIPADFSDEFEGLANKTRLFLTRKINIFGIDGGDLKRVVLKFSKLKTTPLISDFVIEKSPRQYSDQYLEVTKDFHIFN